MQPVVEIIHPRKQSHTWKWAVGGVIAVFVVGVFAYAATGYYHQTHSACDNDACTVSTTAVVPSKSPSPSPSPTPVTVPDTLNGLPVARGSENIHPLAVMIENHPDARPQSGLGQASLVYEAIAEGGITRFMAVFADPRQAVKVGPVRSARTYYVDYATELNAFLAHVGGNMDALDQIKATGVLDLDQFSLGSAAYHREPRAGIAIEHTMYSSTELLWNYATNVNHWSQQGNFSPWLFQPEATPDKRPASQKVEIQFSSYDFQVDWNYDPATNTYTRTMAGTPHKDANTGNVIQTKNIVLQTVDRTPTVTRIGENGWIYTTHGSGKAVVIENGVAIQATWKKEGNLRTRYFDASGKEIAFVPGTTWVEIVHPDIPVSY